MPSLDQLLAELTSGDEARAEAVVSDLIGLGDEALIALRVMLSAEDADHRWWALCTLASAPQSQTEWLLPLLDDSVPEVRQAAVLGLCSHPDEMAISSLIRALSDTDSMVSGLAGNALVTIGEAAVPSLMEIPKDAPQIARINATRALAEIADKRSIPMLMAALEDDSVIIQHWAAEGLERMGLNMVYLKPE